MEKAKKKKMLIIGGITLVVVTAMGFAAKPVLVAATVKAGGLDKGSLKGKKMSEVYKMYKSIKTKNPNIMPSNPAAGKPGNMGNI